MTQPLPVVQFNPDNPNHVQLKDAVYSIQKKCNQETLGIWISLEKALKIYHLDSHYRTADILREGYYEGLIWIEQGGDIKNPTAWLRYTGYRRIRSLKQIHETSHASHRLPS